MILVLQYGKSVLGGTNNVCTVKKVTHRLKAKARLINKPKGFKAGVELFLRHTAHGNDVTDCNGFVFEVKEPDVDKLSGNV